MKKSYSASMPVLMPVFRVFQIRLFFIFLCHLFFFRAKPISGGPNPYTICSSAFTCGRIKKSIPYPFWGDTRPDYCGHPDYKLICREDADPEIQIAELSYRVIALHPDSHTLTITRTDLSENYCKPRFLDTSMDPKLFLTTPLDVNASLFYNCSSSFISTLFPYKFPCDPNCDQGGYLWVDLAMTTHPPPLLETICPVRMAVLALKQALLRALNDTSGGVASTILGSGFEVKWTADVDRCSKCLGWGGTCGYSRTSKVGCCFYPNGSVYPSGCMGFNVLYVAGTSPESSVTANGRKPEKINWARKIGIAVAAAGVGVGLTCLAVFIYHRRRKRRQRFAPSSLLSRGLSSDPSSSADFEKSSNIGGGVHIFTYTELEEATSNFDSSRELGDGGYGTVYYGKLQDGRSVAVKRLYENNCRRVEQFMNEVKILTGLRHKNLVSLYGCTSRHSRELLLVYEYVSNGTVADHLHGERANTGSLTWPVRMSIAVETASALMYLHATAIIHRDVKTNNILLDNNFCVKVADFGLSRLFPANVTHVSTIPQGTPGYVDPEYHQCYQLTDRSDVYSFGVVLVELISSMPAVDITRHRHEINLSNLAVTKIQNHTLHELVDPSLGFHRDAKVKSMIEAVAELAFQCLQSEKEMRPSMEEVVESLKHASCLVKPGDGDIPEPNPHLRSPDTVTMSWVSRSTTPNSSV